MTMMKMDMILLFTIFQKSKQQFRAITHEWYLCS